MLNKKVFFIRLGHSVVFIFMVSCILYVLFAAIARRYDWALLAALGAIFIEGVVLLLNRWRCPLTTLAEKHGAANGAVTDIFLPDWMTRHTFKISTELIIVEGIWRPIGYFTR